MTEENRDLLHHYVESYVYPKMEDGEVLAVDNEDISAYSEEELTRLAEEILSEKKKKV